MTRKLAQWSPRRIPPEPSPRPKLPYSKRKAWWPAIFLLNLLLLACWLAARFAFLIWHNRRSIAEQSFVWLWRIPTLLGVAWLVYDRVYETDATLSVAASDPKWAFEFPFVITNASHIFAIRNVQWACRFVRVTTEKNSGIGNLAFAHGSKSVIEAGQVLNIDCMSGIAFAEGQGKPILKEGVIQILLEYDADFFGLFSLHRKPIPTTFTWFASASNPQWIKGESAR